MSELKAQLKKLSEMLPYQAIDDAIARIADLEAEAASYHDAYEGEKAGREKDGDIATGLYLSVERKLVQAEAQLAAKDALIREMVVAVKLVNNWRPDTTLHAALTRAKEAGYE